MALPRNLQEVFGIDKTKSYDISTVLPHIYVGRTSASTADMIMNAILEKGQLP